MSHTGPRFIELEFIPEPVLVVNRNGLIAFANAPAEQILGYADEDLVGKPWAVLLPKRHAGAYQALLESCWSTPPRRGPETRAEFQVCAKDGTELPFEILFSPVQRAGWSGVLNLLHALHDWSSHPRVGEGLSPWSRELASVVADGRLTFANDFGFQVFSYGPDALEKGLNVLDTLVPQDRASAEQSFRKILAGEAPSAREYTALRADGTTFEVIIYSSAITRNGRAEGIKGVMVDISDRKRLERQLIQAQKMEAIGRLAGGIAHDFNNLLTIITGYSELLLAELSAHDPKRADLQEIKEAGNKAASLTSQLLAFGRKQILQPVVLDLNSVVTGIQRMLQRLIGEDIKLVTALDPDLGRVRADRAQIEQVILNLAVNARDAMVDGGTLVIETANVQLDQEYARAHDVVLKTGPYVMLAVIDTGCGMDPETQARIFEPFFTTKEAGKGTGLGLSTVYGIVKQSGGYIWVYSEPGRGTTFKIYLPRVEAAAELVPREEILATTLAGTETILLVEDNVALLKLCSRTLRQQGYRVLDAANAEEALTWFEGCQEPVHLLVTDVVLPGTSGRKLADLLSQRNPDIKVLYASGYPDETVARLGAHHAGIPFIQKPFTPETLLRRVREVLDSPPHARRC